MLETRPAKLKLVDSVKGIYLASFDRVLNICCIFDVHSGLLVGPEPQ